MWMKLWQFLLFGVGCFLPVAVMPHPLPPTVDKGMYGIACAGIGVAVAWLGSVGIANLLAIARGDGGRKRRASACTESVTGRAKPLPRE